MGAITWRKTGVYVLVVLPALGLAGIGVIARQPQQESAQQPTGDPVADAARKAREKKKESPKPKKVYENEDVSSKPAASVAAATPAAATKENPEGQASTEAQPKEGAAPEQNKNDEASWRKRFTEARDKLAQAEKELDILQREQEKAQVQYYSDPQKAMNEQNTRKTVNDKDAAIAAKKQDIAQMKQNISNMEEELRKSGGDSGWAR